jgi:hypothetical protein
MDQWRERKRVGIASFVVWRSPCARKTSSASDAAAGPRKQRAKEKRERERESLTRVCVLVPYQWHAQLGLNFSNAAAFTLIPLFVPRLSRRALLKWRCMRFEIHFFFRARSRLARLSAALRRNKVKSRRRNQPINQSNKLINQSSSNTGGWVVEREREQIATFPS